jgi:hypothetical protein
MELSCCWILHFEIFKLYLKTDVLQYNSNVLAQLLGRAEIQMDF